MEAKTVLAKERNTEELLEQLKSVKEHNLLLSATLSRTQAENVERLSFCLISVSLCSNKD